MERVVVVGGGIVGASAAYRLAREAGVRVTLVDRADVGHATAAGAGIVAPGVSRLPSGPFFEMASAAVDFYPSLLEQLAADGETDTGYEVVGGLVVAVDEQELSLLDDMETVIWERQRTGMKNIGSLSRLGPAEARELFPAIADGARAIHLSEGARVDGRLLRDAMTRAAAKRGAELLRGGASVVVEGSAVAGVEVGGRRIACDAVLLAAGAWSSEAAAELGVTLPIVPQRGQILHLRMPDVATARWPFVIGFRSHYLLTFPEDRVVAGATREDGSGFDYRVTAGGTREVLEEALRVAPGLAAGTVVEWRVGFRPMSPDGLPLVGPLGRARGAFVATGLGPSGLMMGPYAGALAAGLLLGGDAPFDLAPFRPSRFAERQSGAKSADLRTLKRMRSEGFPGRAGP
jgi:D-amino-acid dehydrogenase